MRRHIHREHIRPNNILTKKTSPANITRFRPMTSMWSSASIRSRSNLARVLWYRVQFHEHVNFSKRTSIWTSGSQNRQTMFKPPIDPHLETIFTQTTTRIPGCRFCLNGARRQDTLKARSLVTTSDQAREWRSRKHRWRWLRPAKEERTGPDRDRKTEQKRGSPIQWDLFILLLGLFGLQMLSGAWASHRGLQFPGPNWRVNGLN